MSTSPIPLTTRSARSAQPAKSARWPAPHVSPAGVVTTVAGKAGIAGFRPGAVPGLLGACGLAISGTSLYATYDDVIVVVTNVR